jgi:hypothetical protein
VQVRPSGHVPLHAGKVPPQAPTVVEVELEVVVVDSVDDVLLLVEEVEVTDSVVVVVEVTLETH